jgi:GT2 family glycosyltransferase
MTQSVGFDRAIAVVICTRNRGVQLRACLDALRAITFDPAAWELIVVNNQSADDTDAIVRAFAATVPFRVTLAQAPIPGSGRSRNVGVLTARAPLLVFIDDDCYAAPDYLTQISRVFGDSAYGYVGGRVLLHDPADAPVTVREETEFAEVPKHTILRPGFLHGANLAIRRDVWTALGGFDPFFGAGAYFSGDDVEFVTRASLAGWAGAYVPEAIVRHHHRRKPGPVIARHLTRYARGRGAYYMKGILDGRTRVTFLRHWYWSLRASVLDRRLSDLIHEVIGSAQFLYRNLQTPTRTRVRRTR